MKVVRALRDIHIPMSPEQDREEYLMLFRVAKGNLALVSDSYLSRMDPSYFQVFANVNQKFKRDKKTNKKKAELHADMG